ncbi:phage protein Gp27 family protein [Methylomonas sp. BW4-1]|uniref:Phage protein Gp27 family protein n=1 Tax=Methylomonas defluvii TaxID=3045149 RepID=A0ABU4UE63_9GAMM|nr:phage protein Gp27 family protein [Methylomonas sp. OY6]MDX8127742.1 phage protein Gp27 family protein [Methylomonas sp. OY6]
MARLTKLDRLPEAVKTELMSRILGSAERYESIADWLKQATGTRYSKSTIGRFAQALRSVHGGLLELGLSSEALAANSGKLEKLGAYLVQRELLTRRIESLQKSIFGPLGTGEGER